MAVNLLTFDNYTIPKMVVTSNINVTILNSSLYITTSGGGSLFGASNIGTNGVYAGTANSTFLFKGITNGSFTSVGVTDTNIIINYTGTATGTNLGNNSIYAGDSSNIMQFRGIGAGSYTEISSSPTTLIISYAGPVGNSAATSLGNNAVYTGAVNDILQFRGVTSISPILLTATTTTLVINLATTGVTAGVYGTSTSIPSLTINSFGQITSASNLPITQSFATASINDNNNPSTLIIPATPSFSEVRAIPSANWILGNSTSDITMTSDGRLQYTGSVTKWFLVSGRLTFIASNNGIAFYMQIRNSGNALPNTQAWVFVLPGTGINSTVAEMTNVPIQLSQNQYISLFVGSNGAALTVNFYGGRISLFSVI